MQRPDSGAQVAEQFVLRPRDGRRIGFGQCRRDPIFDHGARIRVLGFFGAEQVARGMTASTIAESLGQIRSTIPLGALRRVGAIAAAPEEQNLPAFLKGADVEGEGNRVRRRRSTDRRLRHEIGVQRFNVVVRQLGVVVVGKCRKKVRAVAGDALVHGARESLQRPAPDAGRWVGRDVGRVDSAELGVQRIPASKRLSALPGVARRTMSGCGECLSFGDRLSWKASSARGLNGRDRRPPRQEEEAQQSEDSQRLSSRARCAEPLHPPSNRVRPR